MKVQVRKGNLLMLRRLSKRSGSLIILLQLTLAVPFAALSLRAAPANDADLRWFEAAHVDYHIGRDPEGELALYRSEQPLVGPDADLPPTPLPIARGVTLFQIEVYDGEVWHSDWHPPEHIAWPRAARVRLAIQRGKAVLTNTSGHGSYCSSG